MSESTPEGAEAEDEDLDDGDPEGDDLDEDGDEDGEDSEDEDGEDGGDDHLEDDDLGHGDLDDDLEDDDEPDEDEPDGNRAVGAIPRSVLDFVVRSIVDDPDAVAIDVQERPGRVDMAVTVAPSDMGKVIGRRGHVVGAIRTLVRAAGAREGVEASVEIVD